jgi:uncharacterized protein YdhG (YjbR/CyaY superfamily)
MPSMPGPTTVDEYLTTKTDAQRAGLEAMRAAIRAAAPTADEVITYKMPGFKTHGRFLVSYDAFKAHFSLFPASEAVIVELGEDIRPFLHGSGTIRFPADQPIPTELIGRVIAIRLRENDEAAGVR